MKSIRLKLMLIFSAIILCLCTGISVFTKNAVTDQLVEDAHLHLLDMAAEEAKYVQARVEGRITYISSLAQNPILLDKKMTFAQKVAFFEEEAKRADYLAFGFADLNGDATIFNEAGDKTNIASRDYFQTAVKGQASVSDIIISSATNQLVMIYAAPVYENGKIIGVIYGRRDGNALSEIVSEASYKETGYAYIVNNGGVTVGHKNTALVYAQDNPIERMESEESLRALGEFTKKIISRTKDSGEYTLEGATKIAAYVPIENTPWIVVFSVEKSDILTAVKNLQNYLYLITLLAVAIGAGITFVVSSNIAKPIKKVTNAAQEIAQGNFDVALSVKSKDEVGKLAEAFNLTLVRLTNYQGYIDEIAQALSYLAQGNLRVSLQREYEGQFYKLKGNMEALLEGLNDTMMQIYQASDQVNTGSEQVANSAQALSQGATEQASTIEELSASIAETADQIRSTADNAKKAREKADLAGKEMLTSTDQMDNMISAMKQISMKSSEISKIIKIIEDIAFQTNILSLNAAVEAARAGSAGKGFSVVADEVRNLAAKSAEAAKNTTVLIEDTLKAVEYGSKIAGLTADSLNTSAKATKETVSLIDEIALSSQDQAIAIVQVNQGIEQISSVVQTNAATAEESAAASQELSGQANLLKELISKFQLR